MANKLNLRKTPKAAIDPDPIFAAIVEHKSLWEKWSLLEEEINNIEEAESEKSRDRPVELIAWRSYSSIGDYEIDRAREEFLRQPSELTKKRSKGNPRIAPGRRPNVLSTPRM